MANHVDLPAHRQELLQARLDRWRPDLEAALAPLFEDHESVRDRLEQIAAGGVRRAP